MAMASSRRVAMATALWACRALAQDSAVPTNNLNGFISQVAGVASAVGAADTASHSSRTTSHSSTSRPSTSHSSSTRSSLSTISSATSATSTIPATSSVAAAAAAASSTSATSSPDSSSGGIDARTRDIIIAVVCIVVGLILLGFIFGCLACRRRRRRRTARVESPGSEVGAAAWGRRHDRAASERSFDPRDSSHEGRYPSAAQMSQRSSGVSAMSGTHDGWAPPPSGYHSARDSLNNGHSPNNPNMANPFTPNPPITRKPVPSSSTAASSSANHPNHRNHFEDAALAGAGAAAGAAALRHHDRKHEQTHSHSPLRSNPTSEPHSLSPIRELEQPEKQHRPPTPMGLDAFGNTSHGAVEPSVAAYEHEHHHAPHGVEHPTEAQRRSLSEREDFGAWGADRNPAIPERSPKRSSFGDVPAGSSSGPVQGQSQSQPQSQGGGPPRPMLNGSAMRTHNSFDGYASNHGSNSNSNSNSSSWTGAGNGNGIGNGNNTGNGHGRSWRDSSGVQTESSSPDSWTSAQQLPPPPPPPGVPYEPGRRYSGNSVYENAAQGHRPASRSPRRTSLGPDGKPRRLRFSDVQPEEYRYDNEQPVGQAI